MRSNMGLPVSVFEAGGDRVDSSSGVVGHVLDGCEGRGEMGNDGVRSRSDRSLYAGKRLVRVTGRAAAPASPHKARA